MEHKARTYETPAERKNPWQNKLEKQGLNFTIIPEGFLNKPDINFQLDEKTGFIMENKDMRMYLIEKISDSIRTGRKWAVVYADADNLKTANTKYGRPFGDMVIAYGAAAVTQLINKTKINSNTKITTTKEGHAADEYSVWLFDISDEDIEKLRNAINANLHHGTHAESPEFNFYFSISTAILTYDDPRIQGQLEETKSFLASGENRLAYDFFQNSIKDIIEDDVATIKIEKDLNRLGSMPQDELLTNTNMDMFIKGIVSIFGDSRLSEPLLTVLLKLVSAKTVTLKLADPARQEVFVNLLKEVGISEQQINEAKTPGDLLNIFKSLFGS